jgi:hypothetical protein
VDFCHSLDVCLENNRKNQGVIIKYTSNDKGNKKYRI